MKAPCFNCPDRTGNCHGACAKYAEYKALIDKCHKAHKDELIAIDLLRDGCKKRKRMRLKKKR